MLAKSRRCSKRNKTICYRDPQRPYQKGTVENTNGLIRQFFPKRHYKAVPSKDLISTVNPILNIRPRKCLNFSSFQIFLMKLEKENRN